MARATKLNKPGISPEDMPPGEQIQSPLLQQEQEIAVTEVAGDEVRHTRTECKRNPVQFGHIF